jgi:hypothetical protein
MRKTAKLGMVVAAGAFAIAVPAAAQPSHPSHPTHPSQPAQSHRCAAHKVGYIAHGTITTWSATDNGDGTWTGSIDVNVKQANHHAKGAGTFTLTNTKVRLGDGVTTPVAGDRVFVIGKITKVAKKCTDQSAAGVVTLRRVNVLAPPTS